MHLEPHFTENYMFRTASLLYSTYNENHNENLFSIHTFWEDNQFHALDKRLPSSNVSLNIWPVNAFINKNF